MAVNDRWIHQDGGVGGVGGVGEVGGVGGGI